VAFRPIEPAECVRPDVHVPISVHWCVWAWSQTLARTRGALMMRLKAYPPIEPFAIPAIRTDPVCAPELEGGSR
jgi:hypothetical protein